MDALEDDEFLWLEEIDGGRAVAWVEAQNERTEAKLCDAEFEALRADMLRIMSSAERIPRIVQRGPFIYNFWTDAAQPRGIWRRTTMQSYRAAQTEWELLLDLDALGAAEGQSWVWHGAQSLPPLHERYLITLSPGGGDASVTREFDLVSKQFVADGFVLPLGKNGVAWEDADTLLIAPAYDGEVTKAGYPRTVRRWRRGSALESAVTVFEAEPDDIMASMSVSHDAGDRFTVFTRFIAYHRRIYDYEDAQGRRRLDLPEDTDISIRHGRLLIRPYGGWTIQGASYEAGSLLCIGMADFLAGGRQFDVLFHPAPRSALQSLVNLRDGVVLHVTENVVSRLSFLNHAAGWREQKLEGLPEGSAGYPYQLAPADTADDRLVVIISGFLTPPAQMLSSPFNVAEVLRSRPAQFDASGMNVAQFEAPAADGTLIPYFIAGPEDDAARPVYLHGYGGFEIALTPWYAAVQGIAWCAKGGRFAVANIRGGGEFGPDWHKAGTREGKRIAQDDFAAVAADIEKRGLAPREWIVGEGGSNGGLLIGNMLTRHPERFGALICTIPLLDMRRYTKLLAGASWISEYGDPDKPEDWAFLQEISAYHLARADAQYPPILIMTTRRDDRVHPGHARKMAAKLQAMGHEALYYELAEGGHGFGADAPQQARFLAMEFAFARRQLSSWTHPA